MARNVHDNQCASPQPNPACKVCWALQLRSGFNPLPLVMWKINHFTSNPSSPYFGYYAILSVCTVSIYTCTEQLRIILRLCDMSYYGDNVSHTRLRIGREQDKMILCWQQDEGRERASGWWADGEMQGWELEFRCYEDNSFPRSTISCSGSKL